MPIIPGGIAKEIQFCEAHFPIWKLNATAIGLTVAQATVLETQTKAARNAFDAAQVARNAAKAATVTLRASSSAMRGTAADLIAQIKAFAANSASGSAGIYATAQIPEPATPRPAPAPGRPTDFNVGLNPDGSVTLSWNASDSAASSGAFFTVSRKLPGQSNFSGIGGTSGTTSESRRASFIDSTIPASAAATGAQYIVQGFRGSRAGEASDAITVQFGTGGDGAVVASVGTNFAANTGTVKLAA